MRAPRGYKSPSKMTPEERAIHEAKEAAYFAKRAIEDALEAVQPEETFGCFDSEWIKAHGKRWAKGGWVRYYIPVSAMLDKLGIRYSYKENNRFRELEGYSNNEGRAIKAKYEKLYFNAVAGRFAGAEGGLLDDLMEALTIEPEVEAQEETASEAPAEERAAAKHGRNGGHLRKLAAMGWLMLPGIASFMGAQPIC